MPLGVIGETRRVELHGGVKPFVREAGLFPLELVRLDPALVIGPRPQVVHYVKETESLCEKKHYFVRFLRDFDVPQVCKVVHEVVPDDVQVVAARIESQDRNLPTQLFCLSSSTTFRISSAGFLSHMCVGSLSSVSPMLTEIDT